MFDGVEDLIADAVLFLSFFQLSKFFFYVVVSLFILPLSLRLLYHVFSHYQLFCGFPKLLLNLRHQFRFLCRNTIFHLLFVGTELIWRGNAHTLPVRSILFLMETLFLFCWVLLMILMRKFSLFLAALLNLWLME